MKKKKLYFETINILIDAFSKDELIHKSISSCAVGIIIRKRNPEVTEFNKYSDYWYQVSPISDCYRTNLGKSLCAKTRYTIKNLKSMEQAFEKLDPQVDPKGFYGLLNVVDVLDDIHQNTDCQITLLVQEHISNRKQIKLPSKELCNAD